MGGCMLKIEKLAEKNLENVILQLFPDYRNIYSQKRFKCGDRLFIVDYFLEVGVDKFVFEFDGPTHYTNSSTQLRDMQLETFCHTENYILIRIPYFIQIDINTLYVLFDEKIIEYYNLVDRVKCFKIDYKSGFYDTKIIYPGNFNHRGWDIFWKLYCHINNVDKMIVMREIWHSLENIDPNISMGIGWGKHDEKRIFIEQYPT